MYKRVIRPLLFLIDPETIHNLVSGGLKFFFSIPGIPHFISRVFTVKHDSLKRQVFGLAFSNPVGMAAGFDKEARLYNHLKHFGFSHVEIGTVTPESQPGNPRPRLFRIPKDKAMINRMGFNNRGVAEVVKNLKKTKPKIIIGCNIGKNTNTPNEDALKDYCRVFEAVYQYVDYFVINLSCPNIKDLHKLQDKENTKQILDEITRRNSEKPVKKPVLLKIGPDHDEKKLDEIIEVVEQTGIDGIIATNTTTTRENLTTDSKQIEFIGDGGLSGLPLKQKSTRTIAYISKKTKGKLPVIGVGGIFSPNDALEKLKAGAKLIQIYTGFIYEGPSVVKKINKQLLKNTDL